MRSQPLLAVVLLAAGLPPTTGFALAPADPPAAKVDDAEAFEIAVEAYVYAYPLVLMDVSRRVMTNVEAPTPGGYAPVNQFGHKATFPDATFTDVVRPNADTLYSTLWFDVTAEPLVVSVPDSGGRFYLLPMLDLWTDIFASPGKRTTGTGPQAYAIAGPNWSGTLPGGLTLVRSPTAVGWLIGRTQTNGKADYDAVHAFQHGLETRPLSAFGKPYTHPAAKTDPGVPKLSPADAVDRMTAAEFFARFSELTRDNPPHANDQPVLARMRRIGLEPGKPFDLKALGASRGTVFASAVPAAQAKIRAYMKNASPIVNGWSMVMNPVGTYGTDYLKRAVIAYAGLGANVVEDAIYPTAFGPGGRSFDSGRKYRLHFPKGEVPPARAFWSLTMYDERQLFTENPIGRYAIGDRDHLKFNADGSLDLYIQRDSPGPDREGNWLPAPKQGTFTMNLRLYWPKPEALDGTWKPPAVEAVE